MQDEVHRERSGGGVRLRQRVAALVLDLGVVRSGIQNRTYAAGATTTSSSRAGEVIRTRRKCGASSSVPVTVASWSRAP
ncbi:hypothetical protein AB9128_11460 [Streptomyces cinereoruber]|uniref:hypothetical protein n=1 Tax=Streptomyces cinereoruber TaxID=67260 RepID=UPI003EBC7178